MGRAQNIFAGREAADLCTDKAALELIEMRTYKRRIFFGRHIKHAFAFGGKGASCHQLLSVQT
jgi:hypothetical protein